MHEIQTNGIRAWHWKPIDFFLLYLEQDRKGNASLTNATYAVPPAHMVTFRSVHQEMESANGNMDASPPVPRDSDVMATVTGAWISNACLGFVIDFFPPRRA